MPALRLCLLSILALPLLAQAATPVTVATVEMKQPVRELLINGTLAADQAARLSASVSGLVNRVGVDIGDAVGAGDVLLELDAELNQLALRQAQASYRQQAATLNDAKRRLTEANSLSRSIAASEIRSLEAEVETSKASLAASQAEVLRQKALLKRHTLSAPFAGVISAKLTEVGEWVTPGTPVLELVGSNTLHADFAVPQRYFSQISRETPLTIRLESASTSRTDSAPQSEIPAEITAIVPVNDPSARTFVLRASLPSQGLTAGMAVFGNLSIQSSSAEPVVPRDALLRDVQGNVSVWLAVVNADGNADGDELVARRRAIKVRPGQSDPVIVLEGLRKGDKVVVRGNEGLRDGDRIQVTR